jgi:hypothetical protein
MDNNKQQLLDRLSDRKITVTPIGYIAVDMERKSYQVSAYEWNRADHNQRKQMLESLCEEDQDRSDLDEYKSYDYVVPEWDVEE